MFCWGPAGVPSGSPFPPQLFAFLGFLTSALWINAAATEVVNILRSLGVIFRLSNTVLGLTLLAWGNSIGGNLELWVDSSLP
jgi:Ca2+/Na+ antiporter